MGFPVFNNLNLFKMIHTIYNNDLFSEISIDETLCENTQISISNTADDHGVDIDDEGRFIYLSPKQLNDIIGVLLHIQAKKRKEYKTKY